MDRWLKGWARIEFLRPYQAWVEGYLPEVLLQFKDLANQNHSEALSAFSFMLHHVFHCLAWKSLGVHSNTSPHFS